LRDVRRMLARDLNAKKRNGVSGCEISWLGTLGERDVAYGSTKSMKRGFSGRQDIAIGSSYLQGTSQGCCGKEW